MLRIEGFIDDKHAAKVIHALAGFVMNFKILPVVNAEVGAKGELEPKTNGSCNALLFTWLKEHKKKTVRPGELKHFALGIGRTEGAYSIIAANAVKAGILKQVGKGRSTSYEVIRK